MKIIIGLGNPGKKYERSRHNLGFRVLAALASDLSVKFTRHRFNSYIAKTHELLLVKPQTFMNESGQAIRAIKNFYKLSNHDFLIVQDEIDLPFKTMRFSKNSGSAGHLGVASIIGAIGRNFSRLRIGIDNRKSREEIPTDDYVMQKFTDEEEMALKKIIPEALTEIQKSLISN